MERQVFWRNHRMGVSQMMRVERAATILAAHFKRKRAQRRYRIMRANAVYGLVRRYNNRIPNWQRMYYPNKYKIWKNRRRFR